MASDLGVMDADPEALSRSSREVGFEATTFVAVVALAVALAAALSGLLPVLPIAGLIALPLLFAVAVVGLTRFELLVLVMIVTRAAFDYWSTEDGSGPPVAMAIGGAFLAAAGLWMIVQIVSGTTARLGPLSVAAAVLASVAVLAVLASENRAGSAAMAGRIAAGLLMFVVIDQLLGQGVLRRVHLQAAVVLGGVIPVAYGLFEVLGPTPLDPITGLPRVSSTFVHPNTFAAFLVMSFFCSFAVATATRGVTRLAAASFGLVCLFVVIFTYTRVAYLAIVVGLAYVGVRRTRLVLVGLSIAVVVLFAFVPSVSARFSDLSAEPINDDIPANSLQWRFQYWAELAPLILESPATGIGTGMVLLDDDRTHAPRNVWMQLAVETGALGVIAGLGFVAAAGYELWRREAAALTPAARLQTTFTTAVALSFLAQTGSENMLDSTLLWWYLAAALAIGTTRSGSDSQLMATAIRADEREQTPAEQS